MRLKNILISSSGLLLGHALRIQLEETDTERWNERQIKQIPKPVLGAFADHLHTIASLFSSLIGTGVYKDPSEDALDCQHTQHGFGPYCMISYNSNQQCYQEFGCEFYNANINFNNDAKLCCFKNYENLNFEQSFIDIFEQNSDLPIRLFQHNQNNVGQTVKIGSTGAEFQVVAGHFGLAELIYVPNPKPLTNSIIFPTWDSCPFDDAVGYHSMNLLPEDYSDYKVQNYNQDFIHKHFSMCTVEVDILNLEIDNKDVRTLMPYCTFKLLNQECPAEAPLEMSLDQNIQVPNDNLFSAITYIDHSSICCAKAAHDTKETTIIDIDYLKNNTENYNIYDYFNARYQVLKWPHADCAEFEYPKFDLTVNTVELRDKQTYPFSYGDMELTFCTYTKPMSLDDIFSPTSSFDQTLSEIEITPEDENEILTRRCEEDDDCYVPPPADPVTEAPTTQPVTKPVEPVTTPIVKVGTGESVQAPDNAESVDNYMYDYGEDMMGVQRMRDPNEIKDDINDIPALIVVDDHEEQYFLDDNEIKD